MNFYPIKTVAADRLYITQAVTLGTSDKWVCGGVMNVVRLAVVPICSCLPLQKEGGGEDACTAFFTDKIMVPGILSFYRQKLSNKIPCSLAFFVYSRFLAFLQKTFFIISNFFYSFL
jgi:hypothetical protein